MNANNGPIRVGIIGCGNVTQNRHLPAIQSVSDLQVISLADIDHDRVNRAADSFRILRRYGDYRALLADEEVDAVAICAPLSYHSEMALAALDGRKHVLVEKPLALSLDEADTLIQRAADSPSRSMVGYNLRWHRLVRRAKEIIAGGKLGRIELVSSIFTSGTRYKRDVQEWKKRRLLGGGVLMEFATHYFDLWRFLLSAEVEEVHGTARSDEWDDVTGTLTAHLSNGALASAYFSEWTSDRNELHIYGRAGSLHLDLYRFDGLELVPLHQAPGAIGSRASRFARALWHLPRAMRYFRLGGEYYASFVAQWRHFADAIQQGVPLECTLEDGRRALQIALAAAESATTGEAVRVEHAPTAITPPGAGSTA